MASQRSLLEGLQIIDKYHNDNEVAAGKDEIWVSGPSWSKLEPDDRKRLDILGWSYHDVHESWVFDT